MNTEIANVGVDNKIVVKVLNASFKNEVDNIAEESALEISLEFSEAKERVTKNIALTMRTSGNDEELATGFLFSEGIIKSKNEIIGFEKNVLLNNKLKVKVNEKTNFELEKLSRHLFTSSSCGVCGKTEIDNLNLDIKMLDDAVFTVEKQIILTLNNLMKAKQKLFNLTGGIHGTALFSKDGKLIKVMEDVGRHNAFDKLIGFCLNENLLPLKKHLILVSGRLSFELVQKAIAAGCKILIAVGAPSSFAIDLATQYNLTLIGFLKEYSFNIYAHKKRIIL